MLDPHSLVFHMSSSLPLRPPAAKLLRSVEVGCVLLFEFWFLIDKVAGRKNYPDHGGSMGALALVEFQESAESCLVTSGLYSLALLSNDRLPRSTGPDFDCIN